MKKNHLNVVQNETCFGAHSKYHVCCEKTSCENWVHLPENQNCVLIAATKPMILQDIGDIFGLTRMRICQIQKTAVEKIINQMDVNRLLGIIENIKNV